MLLVDVSIIAGFVASRFRDLRVWLALLLVLAAGAAVWLAIVPEPAHLWYVVAALVAFEFTLCVELMVRQARKRPSVSALERFLWRNR